MLKTHEKFWLMDKAGKHKLFAEVNWNPKDSSTNECRVVRFTCPNGDEIHVDKKHLLEMLFAMGKPEEQQKMIPQKLTRVRWYETVLSIKAKKDIHRGELITFPIKLSLPPLEEEVVGEIRESAIKSNIPLIGSSPQ